MDSGPTPSELDRSDSSSADDEEAGAPRFLSGSAAAAPQSADVDSVIRWYVQLEWLQLAAHYVCVLLATLSLLERLVMRRGPTLVYTLSSVADVQQEAVAEVSREEAQVVFALEYTVALVLATAAINGVRRAYAHHHNIETTVKYKRS